MSIVIDDPEIERLARALAAETGESVEEVIARLLRERSVAGVADTRDTGAQREERIAKAQDIVRRIQSKLSDDDRTADEILGYDERGLPT